MIRQLNGSHKPIAIYSFVIYQQMHSLQDKMHFENKALTRQQHGVGDQKRKCLVKGTYRTLISDDALHAPPHTVRAPCELPPRLKAQGLSLGEKQHKRGTHAGNTVTIPCQNKCESKACRSRSHSAAKTYLQCRPICKGNVFIDSHACQAHMSAR